MRDWLPKIHAALEVLRGSDKLGESRTGYRDYNRAQMVQGSCAIEANPLDVNEVLCVMHGKYPFGLRRVRHQPHHIQEVKTAIRAYDMLDKWSPFNEEHLLEAHDVLMQDLMGGHLKGSGRYRTYGVRVGTYVAPRAELVPELMGDLIIKSAEDLKEMDHPLLVACMFHCLFEGIHPFGDGNGRMGRLWQTLIASKWEPLFAWIPVESRIYANQMEYYKSLSISNIGNGYEPFMAFMLERILEAIQEVTVGGYKLEKYTWSEEGPVLKAHGK